MEYSKYVHDNAAQWEEDALCKHQRDGGCITCRAIVKPRVVTSITTHADGSRSALCPYCGSPTLIGRLFTKDRKFPRHGLNWGHLLKFHMVMCAELHGPNLLGSVRAVMYQWIDAAEGVCVKVLVTIPNTEEDASHMGSFIFETIKTRVDTLRPIVTIGRSVSEDLPLLRPQRPRPRASRSMSSDSTMSMSWKSHSPNSRNSSHSKSSNQRSRSESTDSFNDWANRRMNHNNPITDL